MNDGGGFEELAQKYGWMKPVGDGDGRRRGVVISRVGGEEGGAYVLNPQLSVSSVCVCVCVCVIGVKIGVKILAGFCDD